MGLAWSLLASLLFSVMGVFVKLSSAWFEPAELVFYRSLFGLLLLSALMRSRKEPIRTPLWRWHVARGLSGAVALLCFFYAIAHLPLSSAISLNYTSPLFLALYLAVLHREKPAPFLWLAAASGFAGVWLMLRPAFAGYPALAIGLGLTSGALAGFAYLALRQLGAMHESADRTVWYFTLTSLAISALVALATGWHWPDGPRPWLMVAGMSLAATGAQMALTRAYQHGPALAVGSLAYSTVLFSALAQWLLWPEHGGTTGWAGQLLIVLSGVIVVWARAGKGNKSS